MHFLLQEKSRKRSEFVIFSCFKDSASKETARGAKLLACEQALPGGHSGGGAEKGRRACNYVSPI